MSLVSDMKLIAAKLGGPNRAKWVLKIDYLTNNDPQMVVYATGGWDENNVPHLYNGTVAVVKSSNNSMTLNRHITKQRTWHDFARCSRYGFPPASAAS